ncbi:hypothetical protein CUMW_228440 [Citrus unshiu]|uniref:Serine-threonine/tyrosine-protein kinase catalytic domain-containing protein n=1 Tax=Citrus unshiu TaxID=55188 RepID=A0A2H5QGN8_CITUN|nr:hypothetical protein CUMW_228440 [Citrus unshiu]
MLIEGETEFHTWMKVIRRTHHRNLVRLLGYSFEISNKILVCETNTKIEKIEKNKVLNNKIMVFGLL